MSTRLRSCVLGREISETVSAFASLKAMLPLKATPCQAASEAVELPEGNSENRQIAREAVEFDSVSGKPLPGEAVSCILDSPVRNVGPDAQASIRKALAVLRADLKVVEEAIQALESIAPESLPRLETAPMPKPRKVVDIHSKRA